MVSDNARLIMRFAATHPEYREVLRHNPAQAVSDYADEIHLSGDVTQDEMAALASVTDEEYAVMQRIGAAFKDPLDNSVQLSSGSII
jgi:hypothetical protein